MVGRSGTPGSMPEIHAQEQFEGQAVLSVVEALQETCVKFVAVVLPDATEELFWDCEIMEVISFAQGSLKESGTIPGKSDRPVQSSPKIVLVMFSRSSVVGFVRAQRASNCWIARVAS